ncbi:MAG: hypothetical protein ACFFAU_12845 [Candidatus Hodarchaeota archaeon]
MGINPQTNLHNQKLIIQTLFENNHSMTILHLKQITKLANLYFFKALEELKIQNMIIEEKKERKTWIRLLDEGN